MQTIQIEEALVILELSMDEVKPFMFARLEGDMKEAKVEFVKFKERVKKQRRLLAKKWHPDVCGEDTKMKLINKVADAFMAATIDIVNPQPMTVRVYTYTFEGGGYDGGTTTSGPWY